MNFIICNLYITDNVSSPSSEDSSPGGMSGRKKQRKKLSAVRRKKCQSTSRKKNVKEVNDNLLHHIFCNNKDCVLSHVTGTHSVATDQPNPTLLAMPQVLQLYVYMFKMVHGFGSVTPTQ